MSSSRSVLGAALGAAVLLLLPTPASAGVQRQFSGIVFEDMNGDGLVNPEDVPLEGCTVAIDSDSNGSIDDTQQTDAEGTFLFLRPSGSSAVITATCSGLTNLTGARTYPSSAAPVFDADFSFFDPGQVFGDTFDDADGDGTQDPGEPFLDGCTVTLDEGADGSADDDTTTTDGFFFTGLGPGTVRLRATCAGRAQTTANPADILVTSGLDQGGILFGFGAQAATTTTTAPATTTTGRVLARTGPAPDNGGLGAVGVGLLLAGSGLVLLAARRRAA